jgi:16S rRNA processing protein RimM
MKNEKLVKIGATLNPHGLKGELKVFIEEQYEEDFFQCDTVFLTLAGKQIPYFIENLRGGNSVIVKFEEIDSIEAAQKIAKKSIEIRESDLIPDDQRETEIVESYAYVVGFTIIDEQEGVLGIIDEIVEMPQQEVAVLQYNNKETLIPLNDAFVSSIDETKKEILVNLPEGLLSL